MEIILLLSSDHILMGACHLFLATELYFLHNTTGCFTYSRLALYYQWVIGPSRGHMSAWYDISAGI